MGFRNAARQEEPTREAVERTSGPVLLEFGARWCGYCQATAPEVAALLEQYPRVQHIKVEDGPGRPLGRSFRVKLWPTFVFLRDGRAVATAVRPETGEIRSGLDAISKAH
jgi:thioredoxin 1